MRIFDGKNFEKSHDLSNIKVQKKLVTLKYPLHPFSQIIFSKCVVKKNIESFCTRKFWYTSYIIYGYCMH